MVGEIPNTARNRPLNILVTEVPGIWQDVITLVIIIEETNEVEMNTSSGRPGDLRELCIVAAYPNVELILKVKLFRTTILFDFLYYTLNRKTSSKFDKLLQNINSPGRSLWVNRQITKLQA